MTQIKSEKNQWINPDNHSIAVDDHKQPVVNENGDLIVLDNTSGKCIAVPNTDEILEAFGFGYNDYGSPPGSLKDSSEHDLKPLVQVLTADDQLLWSMRTPCQKDIEATREMLSLVASKKYQDMFNDQCTVKIRVWKRICEELMSKGYRIADSVNEGGIKCHQKWRNLEKSYRNFLISSSDPGATVPKKPPPYFEALHSILKKKKKYANAVSYTQTVVVDEEMLDPDASGNVSSGGLQNSLNYSDTMDDLDDMDGQNDDHCYVVNSSGHVSKRFRMDPLAVCSTTSGGGGGGGSSSGVGSSSYRRNVQQPDALEQILEQLVRLHRESMAQQERHAIRMEKIVKDNTAQTRRLADVMNQLLQNPRSDDEGKIHEKMSGATSSDAE